MGLSGLMGLSMWQQQQMDKAYANLKGFIPPPDGANVPARSLKPQQARDMALHYWVNKMVAFETLPTFDSAGQVLTPKPGAKVRVCLSHIAGVNFVADSKAARSWVYTNPIQMRTVVLIVRFAQMLRRDWNASVLYWGGLGAGREAGDMHEAGWALDFHGADTSYGNFNVSRDWGNKPVPASIGGYNGKWPASAQKTSYRLDTNPLNLGQFVMGAAAREFFKDCYMFAAAQANNRNNLTVHYIGEPSSVLHPDTPFPGYRDHHQDHIHMDVI